MFNKTDSATNLTLRTIDTDTTILTNSDTVNGSNMTTSSNQTTITTSNTLDETPRRINNDETANGEEEGESLVVHNNTNNPVEFTVLDDLGANKKLGSNKKCPTKFFEDIRMFTFFMCVIVMLTNALVVGYRNSVITTIEKRFEFSSVFSGILSGCLEVGSLITTLFVSYFCAKSHIPRCIAVSSIVCAIGTLLYAMPHFLSGSYTAHNKVMTRTTSDLMCKTATASSVLFSVSNETLSSLIRNSPLVKGGANNPSEAVISSLLHKFDINSECLLKPSNVGHFSLLILANVLIGSSSAPLYTLGTAYIDNHVHKDSSSVYLAFIYSMLAFGPLVGYLVGAALLRVYVDGFIADLNIDPSHNDWVGAWYAGFLLFGVLIFLTSFSFFCFPKKIKKSFQQIQVEEKFQITTQNNAIDESSFGNFKTLPKAIKNILSNKVFMLVTFAFCFEITIISGFMTFLPKYIEHQFSVNNSLANIYTGGIAIPGACVGIVTGGFLVKRFKINPKSASLMATACNIVCLVGIIILIFIGCENVKMAGTTTSYMTNIKSSKLDITNRKFEIGEFNLTTSCNSGCQCSTNTIEPICGINGITYFSPCYAGCKNFETVKKNGISQQLYSSCKCIRDDLGLAKTESQEAQSGLCSFNCRTLFPFLFILFFITFLTALNQMPMLMVTLRSVTEIERPFALGLQLVIMRLLAYIPSPLIFGQAIEWTCLIWQKNECDKTGSCLFYDREKFRHIYGSIAAVYKAISLVLFICLYLSVRKYNFKTGSKIVEVSTMLRASITSLNSNQQHKENKQHKLKIKKKKKHEKSNNNPKIGNDTPKMIVI